MGMVCLSIILLAACKDNTKQYVIGVSQCSMDIWRSKLNRELKMGEYLNDSLSIRRQPEAGTADR